ncbi:gliding motility-associated C-terminal domain-containing protein [Polaribacter porphyrae]|uniref:Cadherin domain-containing protein n=1 Tax=Polaribacter porphyrae TaxID=1137780 RepID=A0A2S7WMA5_9FLAO|nr:gliding motility-associated C-terminal domain-containing protein [Polaribacter porphyrae]PQJ78738.1 hypothetical protein BTO18_05860 [Polaribacter porphyrae]
MKNSPKSVILFFSFFIQILSAQVAPTANDDNISIESNTSLAVNAPGVLANDTDPDAGDVLTVTEFSINSNSFASGETVNLTEGDFTLASDGSYTFNPAQNYTGNLPPIIYTITDGTFTSSASLNISVLSQPPTAVDDANSTEMNSLLSVNAPGVLVNDTDPEGDALVVTTFSINGVNFVAGETASFPEGVLTIRSDGSYTFNPRQNYTGDFPVVTYSISDATSTASANLRLIIFETTTNLLNVESFSSCNQGYTQNGEYKVNYSIAIRNTSISTGNHPSSLLTNIDLTNNLRTTFGNDCVLRVDQVAIRNDNFVPDYLNNPYPREFTNSAINPDFLSLNSTTFFDATATSNLVLYPRQAVYVDFCVTINPFCNGRPNPTPSGSGIDFTNNINVTSNNGNDSSTLTLTDFHTTETVVAAGLHVPEFNNDQLNPPGVINPDGTYDYVNTLIITNEGATTANNINFNMGLGDFLDNGITFSEIRITQVSGPSVAISNTYDGDTNTQLLAPNNSLDAGQTITLELFYLIEPYNSTRYSFFNQINLTQTQGILDGFDETTANNKKYFSYVTWSDNLGNHTDRYYYADSQTANISSINQCNCRTSGMRFLFISSTTTNKSISDVKKVPNGILEHEEVTFQITVENTSESVQLQNLQIEDDLNNICNGNIISVSTPIIQNSTATITPTLNSSFDGISNFNIFDGSSGLLKINETITVQFTVLFNETCRGANTATFTSTNPLNVIVRSSSSVTIDASTDTDNDGIPNDIDIDDDNDTITDLLESGGLDPLADDDADFIPNYRDTDFGVDTNADGIVDIFDFDNDGVPNHFDLDSDNDGILDIVEVGNIASDTSNNGRTNGSIGFNGLDNTKETNDSSTATINYILPNTDANGNANFLDIDADDDGIVDNIEAQPTSTYITTNSIFSNDGIDTAYPNGLSPVDSDNDSIADYIDTNSDNDTRDDIIEGWDVNSDEIPETVPTNLDIDNDGLDDAFDTDDTIVNPTNNQTPLSFPNFDNADTPERDWREILAVVVLITNDTKTESEEFVFNITLVTKNDNSILIESATPISISFSTSDGTDTTNTFEEATAPFDYIPVSNTILTIPALTNTSEFRITSLEDPISELTELFTLNGTITTNNTINASVKATASILDNDALPSITMNNSREDEGVDLAHTITLSHPSSRPTLIDIKTEDLTAISPEDYTTISQTIDIRETVDPNNANTEISFYISSNLDNLNELDEEVVNVSGIVTSSNIGNQDLTKTATILDVDPNPLLEINNAETTEGGVLEFTINLLNASSQPMQNYLPISISLETIDNTTTANQDYESVLKPVIIPALSSTITSTVKTIDDKLNEDSELLFLQVNINSLFVSNTSSPRGEGKIKDNDYPNLFSPNGDNRSDFFEISGIEDFPNFKLTIFNRLGNQIYNYSNNGRTNPLWWDGTYKGKPAPVGVYFYTLDFNDGITKPISNFIQLIR